MAEKHYVGIGWESRNGFSTSMALKMEELYKLPLDKYGQIHINIVKRKAPDQTSKATHYATEDTFYWEKHNLADATYPGAPESFKPFVRQKQDTPQEAPQETQNEDADY